jgi:hypothetical protein
MKNGTSRIRRIVILFAVVMDCTRHHARLKLEFKL